MEKGIYIKNIKPNSEIAGIFLIENASMLSSRNGSYWRLTLKDSSGSIEAKIWAPLSGNFKRIENGLAFAAGHSSLYREQIQVSLDKFSPLDDEEIHEIDKRDFLAVSPYDLNEMFAELVNAIATEFIYPPWRILLEDIFNDPSISEPFKFFPAAKSVHHAYVGGLLEHSLSVFNLCRRIADHYTDLDRQTLLAGAILHDIGKTREFSGGLFNDYTDEGKLIGHMLLGLELLSPRMENIGLDYHLAAHLKHLILSHHGQYEFGAVRLPQTAEAFALHYADNLDAKIAQCRGLFSRGDNPPAWSIWLKSLDRAIFLPEQTPDF